MRLTGRYDSPVGSYDSSHQFWVAESHERRCWLPVSTRDASPDATSMRFWTSLVHPVRDASIYRESIMRSPVRDQFG